MSLAEKLANHCGKPQKTPAGYLCSCPLPSHGKGRGDNNPSLSLSDKPNGGVKINCLASCDNGEIYEFFVAQGLINKSGIKKDKYEGARFYIYKDLVGNEVSRTVKMPDKKMWQERFENRQWIPGLNKIQVPLYNLQRIIDSNIIYLTEGEKDADTLINLGLPATTNNNGAKSWGDHLTPFFKDKIVVLIPDNDETGFKRVKIISGKFNGIVKELRVFKLPETVGAKGDLTDWINQGGDAKIIFEQSFVVEKKTKKQKDDATRADHIALIEEYFGEVKRDIFSEDLCYFDKYSRLWQPVSNKIRAVRSHIKEHALSSEKKFQASDIEDHLYHLEDSLPPEFMVNVPAWDGVDRIRQLAQRIIIADSQVSLGIDEGVFYQFLKYWHCKMWQRLADPSVRNEIFILAGSQNLGKDFWIRENCEALGQYLVNFSIHSQEKDTKEQLHHGLVMNISEFDRTSRTEASLLKEIVTTTQTNVRFSYDRRSSPRKCYCSFIASTNVKDIFNDPTGHSRYVFFDIKYIDKSTRFSDEDKLQVLAQGQALARCDYVPEKASLDLMKQQIDELTPEHEHDAIMDMWDHLCTKHYPSLDITKRQELLSINVGGKFSGFMPNSDFPDGIEKLTKLFSKSDSWIRKALVQHGRRRVDPKLKRGFYFKLVIPDDLDEGLSY
jgi:hypothetical protein